jgi:hypothetical protein
LVYSNSPPPPLPRFFRGWPMRGGHDVSDWWLSSFRTDVDMKMQSVREPFPGMDRAKFPRVTIDESIIRMKGTHSIMELVDVVLRK